MAGNFIRKRRKTPGPASKTLRRGSRRRVQAAATTTLQESPSPSTSILTSTSPSSNDVNDSTPNMAFSMPRPQTPRSAVGETLTFHKSTCLLCSHPVIVESEDPNSKSAMERNKVIKTLCYHIQMESADIPTNCTKEMFPFCPVCERLVTQVSHNQQIVDEAQQNISKCIATIERTVADAEILERTGGSSSMAATEDNKFVQLRDMILEGYRNKLLMKQKLRERLLMGIEMNVLDLPVCSHNVIMKDVSSRCQFNTSKAATHFHADTARNEVGANVNNISVNASQSNFEDEMDTNSGDNEEEQEEKSDNVENNAGRTDNSDPPNITIEPTLPTPPSQLRKKFPKMRTSGKYSQRQELSSVPTAWATGSSRVIGQYNENSCTMVISDVRSGSASPTLPLVVIKQEPIEMQSVIPIPAQDGKRKRRSLFQGIEILKVTDPRTNKVHLQCSICRHTILLASYSSGRSPHQAMTHHITERHLGKRRRAALSSSKAPSTSVQSQAVSQSAPAQFQPVSQSAPTQFQPVSQSQRPRSIKRKQYTCKICVKTFPDMKTLYEHKSTHSAAELASRANIVTITGSGAANSYYIQNLECTICGRPVKGNLSNLAAHLFSHKNNEERAEAYRNGERGSRNALMRPQGLKANASLSARMNVGRFATKLRKANKGFGSVSRKRRKMKQSQILKDKQTGQLHCPICTRTFSRNCYLVLHLQGHYRRSKQAANTPTQSVVTFAAGNEQQLEINGTEAAATNPQSQEDNSPNQDKSNEEQHAGPAEVPSEFFNEEIANCLDNSPKNNFDVQM